MITSKEAVGLQNRVSEENVKHLFSFASKWWRLGRERWVWMKEVEQTSLARLTEVSGTWGLVTLLSLLSLGWKFL